MKTKLQILFSVAALLALSALNGQISSALAQGTTAFTYQGQLSDGGTNVNGTYTLIFKLYNAESAGDQVGSAVTASPTLVNGLFSVNLDFGHGAFDGSARWLDIAITNTNSSAIQELSPRTQVLTTPYAQFAAVAATVTNGAITTAQIADGAVTNQNLAVDSVADENIVFVTGSKVTGVVNAAAGLVNGPWNVSVGAYDGNENVLGFYSDGAFVYGIGEDGSVGMAPFDGSFTLSIEPGQLYVLGDLNLWDQDDQITFATGAAISDDGSGGVLIGGVDISDGSINANDVYANNLEYTDDGGGDGDDGGDGGDAIVAKAAMASTNSQSILAGICQLKISMWNPKNNSAIRHIGPEARDFQATFGFGKDGKTISLIDETGIALAGIQGLNQKVEDRNKEENARIQAQAGLIQSQAVEIAYLKEQNNSLAARLDELAAAVNTLEQRNAGATDEHK